MQGSLWGSQLSLGYQVILCLSLLPDSLCQVYPQPPTPPPPFPLGMVSICFHCSFSVTVPGGCRSQDVLDTLDVRLGLTRGPTFLISGTIPQAHLLLMS